MMQMLQTMLEDRQAERAERQANIAALQQLANNNQGHHDHPGSKLKNFQNTNPPIFNKTEEPLDADDWLQTMENNLEVAGVEAAEKVLFATHYLAGPARAWWTSTRAMNAGQMMTWEDFKLKFSKYHVPQGLIKKMRDEFRELKQGRMSVVEYRDRFLTLSRYAPDETDTNEKRKERFLNGLHDEMQTVLVNIPFADLEALVDSAIQMEGKLHQANENRKRRMMNQNGPNNAQKYRNNSTGGFASRYNKPPAQIYHPSNNNNNRNTNNNRNNNNNNNNSNQNNGNRTNNNNHPNGNNNHPNTAPVTGSNAVPVNPKDKSTVNCYECGVVGHYSNECPKKLARIAANTAAPAQQQRRFAGRRNQNNNNGRFYHMTANEAQEAPQAMPKHNHAELYVTHRAISSPLPSKPINHVSELAWTLLMLTLPALDQDDVDIDRATRAQTRPEDAHARQDAHGDIPGRDRTPPCPVASRLPSLSPCARRLTTVPSTSRTSPIGRGPTIDDARVKDHPPPYCHTAPKRTTRLHHLWPRHEARQHRLDVANTLRPSLAPSSPWNGDLAVDPPALPRPPPRTYKKRPLREGFLTPFYSSPLPDPPPLLSQPHHRRQPPNCELKTRSTAAKQAVYCGHHPSRRLLHLLPLPRQRRHSPSPLIIGAWERRRPPTSAVPAAASR
ncbi:hypothetical protein QYE76_004795 [Lolium multiflorum]|uniref:CCHC-type domain-containing protein n=1 Tax=Lolium multiflorum TaxID=4521 RepID=A0AAD8W051_LOLMU|nr:hypothetical protein QYE76_004795 [Lolium multiflorum]